ncbi:MAG: hypothetical protein J6V00_07840 [Bacteroidaceae bacterium]|nr:hypothetical protein [Bacteroidaceae bacterium]
MKKFFLLAFAICLSITGINAQVFLGNSDEKVSTSGLVKKSAAEATVTTEQKPATTDSKYKSLTDYSVDLNFDSNIYGFSIGGANSHFGIALGEDISSVMFGYGFGGASVSDSFILKGKLYPYVGLSSYDSETEFLWGAAANISIGVKVHTTKKGNSVFLTFGYGVSAPELETTDMFDNGSWGVGITVVCW